MQKIILKGHLGRDAELVTFGDRQQVKFTVACTEGKGERANTTWYDVFSYATKLHPYLLKGKEVVVMGSLSIRKTEKDGKTYINNNVYADDIALCGSRADTQVAQAPQAVQRPQAQAPQQAAPKSVIFAGSDELPF